MPQKTAIIVGAGPAGLTAAYELLEKTSVKPIVFEATGDIGGISRTVEYKGNRIDIGGHRFFSKSDVVMNWWLNIMPLQDSSADNESESARPPSFSANAHTADTEDTNNKMLIRTRISSIYFLKKFFDYPVSLKLSTLSNLGLFRVFKIVLSYLKACLFPIKNETTLEEFFINRFGKELYITFFEHYTEKVWGVPCTEIPADWGKQRIKGLSVWRAISQGIRNIFRGDSSLEQSKTETSLIRQFLYPMYGPGQLWERVAELIRDKGGEIHLYQHVTGMKREQNKIVEIQVTDNNSGTTTTHSADYIFSSMPVQELITGLKNDIPQTVRTVAQGLVYRDFITVGLLVKKLRIKNYRNIPTENNIPPDNWIYIQEREVKLGRVQILNNWSPYMVRDENLVWMSLEYFCNAGDALWSKPDEEFITFAVDELVRIGFIDKQDALDSMILHVPKAYPAYFGSYKNFGVIREYLDSIENLFLIGRNGMHRYNNMDHSMLTAMAAVENINHSIITKDNIWRINSEKAYHEDK